MKTKLKNDFYLVTTLTRRNVVLFLKDKVSVFFSLFAALIVLLLYLMFLKSVQLDGLKGAVPEGSVPDALLGSFMDAWMLAGAMSVSCITVTLSANNVMIQDKSKGILMDCYSSPLNKKLVRASYFIGNYIISTVICLIVLAISFAYLAISGGFFMTAGTCFALVGVTLLSILSSSVIMFFITSFLKTESALGGLVGILSAAIGFLIGAYMPISMFPKAIQSAVGFIPGTYSAGLFRNLFMQPALDEIAAYLPKEVVTQFAESYSMKFDFFGADVTMGAMIAVLAVSFIVFLILNFAVFSGKRNTLPLTKTPKKPKKK